MNEFMVNKDSWHYRWLAYQFSMARLYTETGNSYRSASLHRPNYNYINYYEDYALRPYNFCMYWRAVILWPLVRILLTTAIVFPTFLMAKYIGAGTIGYGLWAVLYTIAILIGVCAIIYGAGQGWMWLMRNRPAKTTKNEPGFFETAYKSYKEKFCPNIAYENKGRRVL